MDHARIRDHDGRHIDLWSAYLEDEPGVTITVWALVGSRTVVELKLCDAQVDDLVCALVRLRSQAARELLRDVREGDRA